MTDIPNIPASDVLTLIVYNVSRWKTVEKSFNDYKKLCEVMGKGAMSYEDYEYWFNYCTKEINQKNR